MNNLFKKYNKKIKLLHRGKTIKHLENTLEAIIDGLEDKNFNGIETDLLLTKDNEWIIFHDLDLKRLSSIDKKINELNYNELPKLKYKNKTYKIPKLSDIIKLNYKNCVINLEIKEKYNISNESKDNLYKIIKKIKQDILISSYYHEWYKWTKKNNLNFGHLIENNIPEICDLLIFDKNDEINYKKIKKFKKKIGLFNIKKTNINIDLEIYDS